MPSQKYIDECRKYESRIVIHIRDPRQALLSLVYHYAEPDSRLLMKDFALPDNYFSMNCEQQIDWNIENRLPGMVKYIYGWLEIKERQDQDPNGVKILITTYDELINDELQLFHKILAFYNISLDKFTYKPLIKNAEVLFRQGDVNEWRKQLSDKQKARIAQIVPQDLLNHFGWEL